MVCLHMIDQNLNIKFQVIRDADEKCYCYVLYLFTNVKYGFTISNDWWNTKITDSMCL